MTRPWFSGELDKLVRPLRLPKVKHRTKHFVVYHGIQLAQADAETPPADEDGVSADLADVAEDEAVNAARASTRMPALARGGGGAPAAPHSSLRMARRQRETSYASPGGYPGAWTGVVRWPSRSSCPRLRPRSRPSPRR